MAGSTQNGPRNEAHGLGRVEIDDAADKIRVPNRDDRLNVVGMIGMHDRMVILGGIQAAVMPLIQQGEEASKLRSNYTAWAGLTMLFKLVDSTGARWGTGALGHAQAVEPAAGPRVRGPRGQPPREEPRSRAERLLLNHVRPDLAMLPYATANFPFELRRLRDDLATAFFGWKMFVQSSTLVGRTAYALHCATSPQADVASGPQTYIDLAAQGQPISVPGLAHPITPWLLYLTLRYYGLGTRARRGTGNGFYVSPWQMQRVLLLQTQYGTVDLRWLDWMHRRYICNGQEVRASDPPRRGPRRKQ